MECLPWDPLGDIDTESCGTELQLELPRSNRSSISSSPTSSPLFLKCLGASPRSALSLLSGDSCSLRSHGCPFPAASPNLMPWEEYEVLSSRTWHCQIGRLVLWDTIVPTLSLCSVSRILLDPSNCDLFPVRSLASHPGVPPWPPQKQQFSARSVHQNYPWNLTNTPDRQNWNGPSGAQQYFWSPSPGDFDKHFATSWPHSSMDAREDTSSI